MNTPRPKTYLDFAATTPVDSRVLEAMLPYFSQVFGNSSSVHFFGQQAEAALESSRETLAHGLNCVPREVIFTSCGSESDNLALRGVAFATRHARNADHILISSVEHHAVTRTAQQLARQHGFEVEYLSVDESGRIDPAEVAARLRPSTAIVSVIYANNEIGTINNLVEIGKVCRAKGIPFHTDAVQAAAYLPVDVQALNVDLLSLGAHKFYGPKGVGALYVRSGTPISPMLTGGSQESGLRAGTHNIPYIVGMAEAFRLAQVERERRVGHIQPLRDLIIGRVLEEIPSSQLTGHLSQRLPNHASFVFQGADGNALLMLLDVEGFACSSGSACKTGDPEPSDVLLALGLSRDWALGSLRVTLGIDTSSSEVEAFISALPPLVERARSMKSGA
jgi:cysteine desulfurase